MELQYDGTGLHGWAKQDGLPTIEGSLEAAFRTVLGHPPALRVAGRTDAGVHARRQVVSVVLSTAIDRWRLVSSLNALTPPGITVARVTPAAADFDARKGAVSRTYRYFLCTGRLVSPFWAPYCWRVSGPMDFGALREAAALVEGRHDFTAFTPTVTEHVFFDKTILSCSWKHSSRGSSLTSTWSMEIEAESFLRHMVRTLVGTMVEIGQGVRPVEDLERSLEGGVRGDVGKTAPAHGLFLWDVRYPPRRRIPPG